FTGPGEEMGTVETVQTIVLNGHCLALFTFFGRNQHHTVVGPGPIDRGTTGILQYGHVFNVRWVEHIDVPAHYSIDHHQGAVVSQGTYSPNVQIHRGTGFRIALLDDQTRGFPLEGQGYIRGRPALKGSFIDLIDRTGDPGPYLGAVTNDHHLVQTINGLDHGYWHIGRGIRQDVPGRKASIGDRRDGC